MKWYLIILFSSFSLCVSSHAQQGNPFEIIRTDSNNDQSSDKTQEKVSSTGNVFDVIRTDSVAIVEQEIREENTLVDTSEFEAIEENLSSDQADEGNASYDENPFEVSHVPYRRSELKKQSVTSENTKTTSASPLAKISTKGNSNTFLFWLILFSLLLLAIVMNVQRSSVSKIFKSITNENILKLSKREENNGMTGHYMMLYSIFFINMATFVYLLVDKYYSQNGMIIWLWIFIGLVVIYVLRHVFMAVLGSVFNIDKETSLYSFTILSFNLALGLIFIPVNLVVAYSPENIGQIGIYIGLIIIGLIFIIRLFRGVLISARYIGSSLFQFFLYLCGFEIAPILVIISLISRL